MNAVCANASNEAFIPRLAGMEAADRSMLA
jgi:hypothetical protein